MLLVPVVIVSGPGATPTAAGETHLQRQPVHTGGQVGSSRGSGRGRTGTSCHLAGRHGEPEKDGAGRGKRRAQEEGGVVPEEQQQHVTGTSGTQSHMTCDICMIVVYTVV